MAAETDPDDGLDSTCLFHQLDAYPWDDDQEFQGGLRAILGSVQDPAQVAHLNLRAKCYYYARKSGTQVDFDGYKRWVESNASGSTATNGNAAQLPNGVIDAAGVEEGYGDATGDGGMAHAPKPASFAEICDMIAEGKPIPGIKDIPDTILEGQASDSQAQKRRKPWEKGAAVDLVGAGGVAATDDGGEKPSWMR
ncbi:hypothetical protein B0A55_09638 [Friedmanniomyces simplex]|uniref:Uncharacterized protein n=1 Tax=Friedmanniomyces simplex TaxID=329884 RepID=A0A4V5NED8_9PEZI|nr:hypothetical protein B0A55_09638 [Friedmanniomyces simplex]